MLGTSPPRRYGGVHGIPERPQWPTTSFRISTTIPASPVIEIGAKEFMCIGATPPFDHPHVFCDMGGDTEFICSYCSTLYRYNPELHGDEARPAECAWRVPAAV